MTSNIFSRDASGELVVNSFELQTILDGFYGSAKTEEELWWIQESIHGCSEVSAEDRAESLGCQ